jgi:tetratricopeptide (TPR) repeat protein
MKRAVVSVILRRVCAVCLFVCLTVPPVAAAVPEDGIDPAVALELEYADILTREGFPDYAEIVIGRIKDPAARLKLEVIKLRGLIAQGKFDAVKAVIAQQPNQNAENVWAMKLALADGYYAWGRYGEAQGIYEKFFAAFPDGPRAELNAFFMDSAYKYAQMLVLMNSPERAITAYRTMLKADVPQHVRRQVLSEMAELMMKRAEAAPAKDRKALFDEVKTITDEILWIQDIWFGKAIVLLAHMSMLEGDIEKAQALIEDYRDQLQAIDNTLREQEAETGENLTKMSPMAQCRYLLGVMMQEKAETLLAAGDKRGALPLLAGGTTRAGGAMSGALQHFYNVFVRYPNTTWAPDAGNRANRVKGLLEREYGAKIDIEVSEEQWNTVRRLQFQEARALYNQQQLEQAADAYLNVLNLFPDGATSVAAVGELARCYIELQDDRMARVVTRYLAEGFCKRPDTLSRAGDELIRIAEVYKERGIPERREALYQLFFELFDAHPRTPALLFRFGEEQWAAENRQGALEYYKQVAETYTNSPFYYDALNKLAFAYHDMGERVEEIKTLQAYVDGLEKEARPGARYISGKYRLADAYRALGGKYIPTALNRYAEIVNVLTQNADPYQKTAEDKEANARILQAAMFYKAYCYALLEQPAAKVAAFKAQAIKSYRDLVEAFPQSDFAPLALSQVGTLWTVLEKPDEARKALEELGRLYPESNEAKNAKFVLANNLLKLGRRQQATQVFKEMFADAQLYSVSQMLTVGREMQQAAEYALALEAFDLVLGRTDERAYREPALMGKGKVLIDNGRHAEGAQVLETLLKEYENSGYTIEASFYLSRAYASLAAKEPDEDVRFDRFNNAVLAMKRMRKFAREKGDQAASDVEVARIFVRKARAESEFGSAEKAEQYRNDAVAAFQTLMMLGDAGDAQVRPHIEDAYRDCLPLLMEIGRYADAFADAERYLEQFPAGRHAVEIRGIRSQARMKLATARTAAPAGAEAETETEPAPDGAAPED